MLQGILRWAVPDVSGRLLKRIKRENFLLREHIIEYEKRQAQEVTQSQTQPTVGGGASVTKTEPDNFLRQRQNGSDAAAGDNATTYV